MRALTLRTCTVDLATGQVCGPRPDRLTTRELDLLVHLVRRAGETVPRDALLVEAFGYAVGVASRAVDKAVNSLRAKIEADPGAPEHLITDVGTGYRFEPLAEARSSGHEALARPVDRFHGRGDAMAAVVALLAEPGLATLVGVGGVGKTRLALEAACARAGPVRWVDVASARSREDVLRAAGEGLGVPLTAANAADQVGHALAAIGAGLVVLDNLEQVVAHADLVDRWRRLAPELRLLATSRRPLGLPGERVHRLEPLPVADAVALLVGRAAQRGIAVPADATAERLAERLDGLPLALELAAARLGVLGVAEMTERLDQRLGLLRSRAPSAGRHATLSAALDGSWSLLDGPERTALAELSVFSRDFGVEAAEAVLSPPTDGRSTLDVVDALLDASLVQRRAADGEVRLGLLETVRLYAAERLAALDGAAMERAATHARYYAGLGAALAVRRGNGGATRMRRLARELDHVVVACRWAIASRDAGLALQSLRAIAEVVRLRGPGDLTASLAREVVALPGLTLRERAIARWRLGGALDRRADGEAGAAFERAVAEAAEAGDAPLEQEIRCTLGRHLALRGDYEAARQIFEEGCRSDHVRARQHHLIELGRLEQKAGNFERSWRLLREAEAEAFAAGDEFGAAVARNNAVMAAVRLNRLDEAEALLSSCDEVFVAFGARLGVLKNLATRGQILARRGDLDRALPLLHEAIAGFRELGDRRSWAYTLGEVGGLLAQAGRHREALAAFTDVEPIARVLGDPRVSAAVAVGRAHALGHLGRVDEAVEELGRVREDLRPLGVTGVSMSADLALVEVLALGGRRDEAARSLEQLEVLLAERGLGPETETGAEAARLRATL